MARRKRSRSRARPAGAILLVGGLVLALSFVPGATGVAEVLGRVQRLLLGRLAWLIPASLAVGGIALLVAPGRSGTGLRAAGVALVATAAAGAIHARVPAGAELAEGLRGGGAGLVGGALLWGLRRALGHLGAWVALSLLAAWGVLWAGRFDLAVVVAGAWAALRWAVGAALMGLTSVVRGVVAATAALGVAARALAAAVVDGVVASARRVADAGRRARAVVAERARVVESALSHPASPAPASATPAPAPEAPPEVGRAAENLEPPPAPARARPPRRGRGSGQPPAQAQQESLDLQVPTGGYALPPLSLLADLPAASRGRSRSDPAETARLLEQTLASFGVEVKVVRWEQGPVVTRFEVQPAPGVRVGKISSLANDIALALASGSVRIEGPIPGRSAVGIEVPNQKTALVHIKEILGSEEYQRAQGPLVVALGKDIAGHPIVADLTEMPHLLIAGATGSGKSVMLNAIIAGLLFRCTPLDLRLLLIDPKRVEFAHYANIPHLLAPVVTNPRAAAGALREMLREMEERFERFAATGTRNIQTYNQIPGGERLPYIVIVVDELADLMMVAPADFEDVICRLAQMTRATGIHLVVATQRPSVDVITGLIKANIPSRIAFAVSSQVDSRTILDAPGAEKLLGKGDMLFLPIGAARPTRAQGAFIADSEIQALVAWWKAQGRPAFDQDLLAAEQATESGDGDGDALLEEAARLVVRAGYGSVSLLQRKMKIGYVRAARLVDQLEERGIVGPAQGSNPREVLVGLDELERLLKKS
ncbi:MAG: DNA translocase FtsK [Armatimonadota bacterium]|nr:DNA translocase FtsK [Armatimonadota bacterium]MDR7587498.1 DNA translocase FtsK [Armatimonadota bacterium]MDR7610919.1 DNA translocase FtsK [Armatimonadota bacterium]